MVSRAKQRQLALFRPPDELTAKFNAFHHDHPEVYERLLDMSLELLVAGVKHGSMKMLFEVLRFEFAKAGVRDDETGVTLNNSYTSRYARLLMANEPRLADWFDIRDLRSVA